MVNRKWCIPMLTLGLVFAILSGCGTSSEQSKENGHISAEEVVDSSKTKVIISPGIVGPNKFSASIVDVDNKPQKASEVKLHFSMEGMGHGKSVKELVQQPDGTWSGEGPNIMMAGRWHVQLEWKDEAGQKKTYEFEIDPKE